MKHLVLIVLVVAGMACKKKDQKPTAELSGCARYADMEVRCGEGAKGEGVREIATEYCDKAQKEQDVMSKMIKLEADCAQTTTECAPYHACIEKAKKDHSPFDLPASEPK